MSRRMSFSDALDLVPDDLPDGAYFALAHEMAGLDYGGGFDELAEAASTQRPASAANHPRVSMGKSRNPKQAHKPWVCHACKRRFGTKDGAVQHWEATHGKKEAV